MSLHLICRGGVTTDFETDRFMRALVREMCKPIEDVTIVVRDSVLTDRFDWNSRDGVTLDVGRRI